MSDRTKDLIKSSLFIGGILLMALGWAFSTSLFFWISLSVFAVVFLFSLLDRDLTAVQSFATYALSLISIYNALSHAGG